MHIRKVLILFILFLSQLHYAICVWRDNRHGSCYLANITFTSNSSILCKEASIIVLTNVDVSDSSLELFAEFLDKVERLHLVQSAIRRVNIPTGLVTLNINNPAKPIEIDTARNKSYSLVVVEVVSLNKLPKQIAHLHSIELFRCHSTPVLELDFELFTRMENLTTFRMIETSTKDIIFSKMQHLPKLRVFNFQYSHLTTFNATSWNFPTLEELNLSNNNFTVLPQQIATFGSLTRLIMFNNQIKFIDMQIFAGLRRLVNLYLENNHISNITGELQLPVLSHLRLDVNRLVELDVSQWHLPGLKNINLRCNFLKSVAGFTKCFGGTAHIDLYEGQWDCSWLEEVGRSISDIVISYIYYNSSVQYCYGMRGDRSYAPCGMRYLRMKYNI